MSTAKVRECVRISRAKIRKTRHEAGLCTECGQPNDRTGKSVCSSCVNKYVERQRELRKERLNQGLCVRCGEVNTDTNYKLCSKCREKARKEKQNKRSGRRVWI